MLRRTQWSPDTCECVVVYEWDDSQGEDARVHTFAGMGKVDSLRQRPDGTIEPIEVDASPCAAHAGLGATPSPAPLSDTIGEWQGPLLFAQLVKESQTRQRVRAWALDNILSIRREVVDQASGRTSFDLRPGVEFDGTYSGSGVNRVLNVRFRGAVLAAADKQRLAAFAATSLPLVVAVE